MIGAAEAAPKPAFPITAATTIFGSSAGAGYVSGGKTGTAQAVGIGQKQKYNASKLEEHQRDHALYIAFAPAEVPSCVTATMAFRTRAMFSLL